MRVGVYISYMNVYVHTRECDECVWMRKAHETRVEE